MTTTQTILSAQETQFKFEGSKYRATENLPIKEIAKLIRQDLKTSYPKYKFSVVKESYS